MVEPPTQRRKRSRSLTVTRKGQVTLRKDLLANLGIQPGQRIDVEVLPGDRLELHAEQATGSITSFIGLLAGRRRRLGRARRRNGRQLGSQQLATFDREAALMGAHPSNSLRGTWLEGWHCGVQAPRPGSGRGVASR